MVNPILIIAAVLGAAFFLGLLREENKIPAYILMVASLLFMLIVPAVWLYHFMTLAAEPVQIFTAGFQPPYAINLALGKQESLYLTSAMGLCLLGAVMLKQELMRGGKTLMAVFLIFSMSLTGIIMTRDIFNLFVFFELLVIATAGLILLSEKEAAAEAGFKYLLIAELASAFLLIGIIFVYHLTGTLSIDGLIAAELAGITGGTLVITLILLAVIIELKPFPANGWALDIYQSAHPGFSAVFSGASALAVVFAVKKLLPLGGYTLEPLVAALGLITFVGANIAALSQRDDRRLLGNSSVAQTGLALAALGMRPYLGEYTDFTVFALLITNALAKTILFHLSHAVPRRSLEAWSPLAKKPLTLFAFAVAILMLTAFPPFPSFYAKWHLISKLFAGGAGFFALLILVGSLLEAVYLFRWFGMAFKLPAKAEDEPQFTPMHFVTLPLAVLLALLSMYAAGSYSGLSNLLHVVPLIAALAFLLLEPLPAWVKNTIAIAGMGYYFYTIFPQLDHLRIIFAAIFLPGGIITLLASYYTKGRRLGFYPAAMLMFAGLIWLVQAQDTFTFFAAWELMTLGSYLLILRGHDSMPHALSYILFSLGGAFAILSGFALASQNGAPVELTAFSSLGEIAPWVLALLSLGFMTKTAAIGLHIWLPGAHSEAEYDVSPMVSGILLKAGLFGLMIFMLAIGPQELYGVKIHHILAWVGALSALLGNLMAIFEEDAKRLLAYSSIGQMGYALFGLSLMNHLGWVMALMFVINHYIYKALLFLSVGGVAKRTGTRLMYKMGGLITLMPLSFIAVLIGIIAVSGVPPLSGFGGRWIFYNAIIPSELRLPMILLFLAGPIAFLYLFRLIHTIFLGQLKDENRKLKEAPFWIIMPQMIYVALLMIFAIVPGLALRRVDAFLTQYFPTGALRWEDITIYSDYGYWSPISIMIIVCCIFGTVFGWLLFVNRRAQKVKQFNIVFASERPYRPETTHFSWNFFAPYRKALGFLVQPFVTRFWQFVSDIVHTVSAIGVRFYSGNGQSYIYHLLAFIVLVFLFRMGV